MSKGQDKLLAYMGTQEEWQDLFATLSPFMRAGDGTANSTLPATARMLVERAVDEVESLRTELAKAKVALAGALLKSECEKGGACFRNTALARLNRQEDLNDG
jgi:hypothetical protein